MSDLVLNFPEYLWLLVLLPVFFMYRGGVSRARTAFTMGLRILVFLSLVLALSQPHLRKRNDAVSTYFLVDTSGSVPRERQEWALRLARESAAKMKDGNRAGLIVFGEQATVEQSPTSDYGVDEVYSIVDPDETDIAAAVRLALSTFPEDTQRRIVLLSDGNATRGDLDAAVERAAAAGCPIDVVPLRYKYGSEVVMESVAVPGRVKRGEPFQVRATVNAVSAGPGTLRLYNDGRIVAERGVELRPGENVFVFSQVLEEPGFHRFDAEVESPEDELEENNRAQAITLVDNMSMALLAGETEADVRPLADALEREGILYKIRLGNELPDSLEEWQSYDVIAFANLGAQHMTRDEMDLLNVLVRDLGVGFIMLGGQNSFGGGGYINTPIETLLPVALTVDEHQVLPNGAIVFLMDHIHCIGDRWSKDICVGTLEALHNQDRFGLMAGEGTDWEIPLQPARDKQELIKMINDARVGDIDDINGQIAVAIEALKASKSSFLHIVLITDGNGDIVPSAASIKALKDNGVTFSVALIEPQFRNMDSLRNAATQAGGNFYVVQPDEYHRVPQIIVKESTRVKKGLFVEETFTPAVNTASMVLEGIPAKEIPRLHGYNITSRKPLAEVPLISPRSDAVLAHWQYGLGRTVAFTSDACGRWGREWVPWNRYEQFWAQLFRWCQRQTLASPYTMTLQKSRDGNSCDVIIDALDAEGNFINFLSMEGTLVVPTLESAQLPFRQTSPGRYQASFPIRAGGSYVVNVKYKQGDNHYLLRGAFSPPYNPEYSRLQDDEPALISMADRTGGRLVEPESDLFAQTAGAAYWSRPIWPALLILAACLFPLDIFVRRVVLGPADVMAWVRSKVPAWAKVKTPEGDLLLRVRESIRTREAWRADVAVSEVDSSLPDVERPMPEAAPAEEKTIFSDRLMQAKKRAKKGYDK